VPCWHKPGLVLLDINLPDIKGAEVLERLKSDPALKETPVFVVSADATPRQIRTMTKLGAHAYLTKPLAVGELVSMIGQALAAKAPAPGP